MLSRQLKVLVVDDDVRQLSMVERLLAAEGFEVLTATSPLGVSNIVRSASPDVVLLDVNLPALSGDRLVPLVRISAGSVPPQLVLYSACDPDSLRRLAYEVDADGWIQKGDPPNVLASRLRQLCATK